MLARHGFALWPLAQARVGRQSYRPLAGTFSAASLNRASGLTNHKVGLFSFWLKRTAGEGINTLILSARNAGDTTRFKIELTTADKIRVLGANGSSVAILDILSGNTVRIADGWVPVQVSYDLAAAAAQLYTRGVSDLGVTTTLTNDTINSSLPRCGIMGSFSGTALTAGHLEEFYAATPAAFHDLSVAANLEKFFKFGRAVDLGPTGTLPTGAQPNTYLSLRSPDGALFGDNRGGFADWTHSGTVGIAPGVNG